MELNPLSEAIGELKTDVKWIRESLEAADKKYAPFWVKYPVYMMCIGALGWMGQQILSLIEAAKALFI